MLQETHDWVGGDLVTVRGEQWRVERGQQFLDCELVRLVGTGRANRGRAVSLLWPFDRPERVVADTRVRRVRVRPWLHAFRAILTRSTPLGRLRTAAAARLELKAWQLEPALAMLNGFATRLLLADEVGLGKTIQAGLVVSELLALAPAARILVLTPAGLRDQWEEELRERFHVAATVVDAPLLRRTVTQFAAGTNPWSTWPVVVASLDFAKRADVLRGLAPFTWDLLVVDEAHGCALAPERSAAVRMLAEHARRVILVTATPHGGDERAFVSLCGMGALGGEEPPIVMFRRGRSDVGLESSRRVHLLRVRCTAEEREMHRLLDRYSRAVWRAPATSDARLAMLVLRKRALSSAASLVRSLERRAEALFDLPMSETQLALPFAGLALPEEESPEDAEPFGALAAPGLDDARRERGMLTRLIAASRLAARAESKTARLHRLLCRAREPAIVFTEYRDTVRSVALALESLGKVVTLHGALGRSERSQAAREFTAGNARVLVATDAAGEGLNLHPRCRLVVNLELPWNPLRLEQRIGRVDRLGQQRRAHAVHLVARSTAEERIVERLVLRQALARQSLGAVAYVVGHRPSSCPAEAPLSESVVMAHVMKTPNDISIPERPADPPSGASSAPYRIARVKEVALDECRRLEDARRLIRLDDRNTESGHPGGTLIARLSRRRARRTDRGRMVLRPGLLAVFIAHLVNAEVDDAEQWPCCLHAAGFTEDDLTRVAATLGDTVLALGNQRLAQASATFQRLVEATAARERMLAPTTPRTRTPVQQGIFDRRAIKASEQAEQERAARERDRLAGGCAYPTSAALRLSPPQLALVLVLPG